MTAVALFFALLIVLMIAVILAIAGIALLRRHHAGKVQPLLKYGINLPAKSQQILGIALIVVGGLFLFWVVWSGAEWVILRS